VDIAQTTFFASIEAGMLVPVNTSPNVVDASPALLKAANAGFLGALIMHVYAGKLMGVIARARVNNLFGRNMLIAQLSCRSLQPSF
jgi:hypothetical protein